MTNLSPAANAVWEAFNQDEAGVFVDYGDKLAAAFRAVASQLTSAKASDTLRSIAAELEGAND